MIRELGSAAGLMHSQTIGRIMERTVQREAEDPKVQDTQQVVLRAIRQEEDQEQAVRIRGTEGIEGEVLARSGLEL